MSTLVVNTSAPVEPWSEERARQLARRHADLRGPLLPVLHELQAAFGCVDQQSISVVADVLNLSEAEVYGVLTFYADFRTEPGGSTFVKICRAEACQAMGAESLAAHAADRLGVPMGGTTADGTVTLEQVFCLGNCALSPSVMVGEEVFGRVDADRFDELMDAQSR